MFFKHDRFNMRYSIIIAILLLATRLYAQDQHAPKHEFRAVWVATVNNIDWPSKPGLSPKQQKKEALGLLNKFQKEGFNAVIFQVRPAADAFYPSTLSPWSRYLTGTPGKSPGYDPLRFWIRQCHIRNMEFHAWLNPYRVAQHAKQSLATNSIAFKHPDWIIEYGGKLYLNPALEGPRHYLADVVSELVSHYDVDAIHLDDYFYPYPIAGEPFPDQTTFLQYHGSFGPSQINDWRRNNVDQTIHLLSTTIKQIKPWVKFGISPFGVWRNHADDPRGSLTMAGITSYDQLYANVLKWQEKGWIDYLIPQIYWYIGQPAVNFALLSNWWSANRFNRALYIGQAAYKSSPDSPQPEWRDPGQLPRQLRLLRQIKGIGGSAFFSASQFRRSLMGFQDSLRQNFYRYPAIVPPMKWIDNTPPKKPFRFRKSKHQLKWKVKKTSAEMDRAVRFIVYRNKKGKTFNPDDPRFILEITTKHSIQLDRYPKTGIKYEFHVSALDRLNNESGLSRRRRKKW